MKLLSWNIWRGKHINRVIETLREIDADIIGLQEVVVKYEDNMQVDYASFIAKSLGYEYFFCESFKTDKHTPPYGIGNALLYKTNARGQQCRFLSDVKEYRGNAETEPRTVVSCDVVDDQGKTLSIFNTHLGHSQNLQTTNYQRKQSNKLLELVSKRQTVVMGDFNCLPTSEVVNKIINNFVHADNDLSRPTRFEERGGKVSEDRVDYIFVSKDVTVSRFEVIDTRASDHSLLIADIT